MITLFRNHDDSFGIQVEEELKDMVVAHNVRIIEHVREVFPDVKGLSLPFIQENDHFFSGREELSNYLSTLRKVMKEWDRFQSDACFVDEDITSC